MSPELCAQGGPGARAIAGVLGKERAYGAGFRGGSQQGPPSLRLLPSAPRLGAGAFPARCPPPTRLSPAAPRALREEPPAAVTRQGGNAGARRPCGKEEERVRSAPRPPRGEAAQWSGVGAGLEGPKAGGRALGSARVRAAVGAHRAGETGRGEGCPGLDCCLSSEQTCLSRVPWQLPPQPDSESLCSLFPRGESVAAV